LAYRIQGMFARNPPDAAGLEALARAYGYRLFEVAGHRLWLIDLGVPEPKVGDLATVKAARPLAPSYVDALRVLGTGDETLEQLAWLTASVAAARQLRQPVLGFVSDDSQFDFATLATPDGVGVVDDKVGQYLLRWEDGALTIQPFSSAAEGEQPDPPEELALIPKVTLLATEELANQEYPLHGNVIAEAQSFSRGTSGLGIGSRNYGPLGSLKLLEASQLDGSPWDRAVALPEPSIS